MNGQEEQNKSKSVEKIRQGKQARVEKEKQGKKQITNSEKQRTVMSENQLGLPGFFLITRD